MTDEITISFALTTASILVNVVLVLFVYRQTRQIYKPILITKVLGEEKAIESKPSAIEHGGGYYLVINNVSSNQAANIRADYEFILSKDRPIKATKRLDFLSPHEGARLPLGLNTVIDGHPDLFEERHIENGFKTIPKSTLRLALNIKVTCGSRLFRYVTEDSYLIEWGSLESYPTFEDHPVIRCSNIRNDIYIHKAEDEMSRKLRV